MTHHIAIVTGASSGIGAATAERLSEAGFSLVLVGRDASRLERTRAKLKTDSLCVATDLTSFDSPETILSACRQLNLPIRALVNNAAVFHRLEFHQTSEEIWRQEFETNLFAPVRLIKAISPHMPDGGVILNVSSTLGLRPIAMTSAYSASKAALNNLTQCLALEFAPRLRVLAVCPGLTDTPIHSFYAEDESSIARQQAHAQLPMKRMGRAEDVAALVQFLISEKSNWNTGALHTIDGGISLL